VIGINAQIRSDQGNGSGIGFAVPAGAARRSLHELLTKERVAYAYAGLQTENLTPASSNSKGEPVLVGGDVVVSVAGHTVRGADDLVRIVTNTLRPGRTAVFRVVRAGSRRAITVSLTARVSR
jgi:S1-C subfamily serine protease